MNLTLTQNSKHCQANTVVCMFCLTALDVSKTMSTGNWRINASAKTSKKQYLFVSLQYLWRVSDCCWYSILIVSLAKTCNLETLRHQNLEDLDFSRLCLPLWFYPANAAAAQSHARHGDSFADALCNLVELQAHCLTIYFRISILSSKLMHELV